MDPSVNRALGSLATLFIGLISIPIGKELRQIISIP